MTNLKSGNERAVWSRTLAKPAIIVTLIGALGAALFVPHVVDGHLLSLSVPQTQSLLIAIDLAIAGALMAVLNREIIKEKIEKELLQDRLTSSFRYIGQANVCLELIKEHSVALAEAQSLKEVHQVLSHLHASIAHGVAGATASRLRVISVKSGRTITEYVWPEKGSPAPPSISNNVVLRRPLQTAEQDESIPIIRSSYREGGIVCALAANRNFSNRSRSELFQILLNHFHLLFLFSRDHYRESE
ncbi:MAG: hypothetical protein WD492_02860 [Alkalispirochaeta sp.]